jgi:pSer/pThr/pTyr-binding forkhead associated (FHA) protein
VLSDTTVSRRHARITRHGEAWVLEDLGSLNGTRLNGWRVSEAVELRPGDRVSFGTARYRVS